MLLLIDNFDSFTHNLARYFVELGQDVKVVRNNEVTLEDVAALAPGYIVISPGPCTPDESGISLSLIKHYAGKIPILGVCLGHQCIGQVFGARIVRAKRVMHGKVSAIHHKKTGLLADCPAPINVTRYHSLVIDPATLPQAFSIDAATDTGEIMAMSHDSLPIWGLQFHPESELSEHGYTMLRRFLGVGACVKKIT